MSVLPKIVWPIPSNNRGSEFKNQKEILSHLGGESTGLYMIGRSGMWHGGIHITEATTPWCALSGNAPLEAMDFPVPFKGEQAVQCMADGEVVAYRVCKDYLTLAWESGPLSFSGSFVLVKHYIQLGEKKESGLHFYTLYMHLAPYSAYESESENQWIAQDTLKAFSEMDWLTAKLTSEQLQPQIAGYMPAGANVEWDSSDASLNAVGYNQRQYGLVTLKSLPDADGNTDDKKKGSTSLIPGNRYWVVVDNNNIKPAPGAGPSWWRKLMPPAKEAMKFDQIVCPSPFAITVGDPVGHMGYYQAPKDGEYEARYQVHIECTSMDDNLEKFLTNPERVGEKNSLWLKYTPGLTLYKKDVAAGTFTKDTSVTTTTGILPLSQVQTEADKSTIYDKYGKDMSVIVERIFRIETTHFTSGQYQHCGAPGMEVHGSPPAYGWSSDFFAQHPGYQPTGIWSKKEGKGLSGQGGNAQVTDKPKQFVVFYSVESSMEYIVYYINKHSGNYSWWYSTQESAQKLYRKECGAIIPKFTNEFSDAKQ
ncbi:hypothetical protein HI972_002864 [Salmonella enterica]|nr:hypothetical protein [Salmonella enterica]EHJ9209493.1 hypothetical protein [Salmonella enterica]